jgi:hypothetical protein
MMLWGMLLFLIFLPVLSQITFLYNELQRWLNILLKARELSIFTDMILVILNQIRTVMT